MKKPYGREQHKVSDVVKKLKENILTSVVSVILTGALVFFGSSFRDLQQSNRQVVEKLVRLEEVVKSNQLDENLVRQITVNRLNVENLEKLVDKLLE